MTAVLTGAAAAFLHVSECCEISQAGPDSPVQNALIRIPRPSQTRWSRLSFSRTSASPWRPGVASSQVLPVQPLAPDVSQRCTLTLDQPIHAVRNVLFRGCDLSFLASAPRSWFSRSTSSISSSAWCSCARPSGSRSAWTCRCWPITSGGEQTPRPVVGFAAAAADQRFCCRYMSRPVMSCPGLYDPTTIMNADILAFCQKEGWCKLAFYLLSFFYYLYG